MQNSESNIVDLAPRFHALFAGLDTSHGLYNDLEAPDAAGKRVGREKRTVREGVTLQLWQSHLLGQSGLGVVPICADGSCVWGAIDVDQYSGLDHKGIATKLQSMKLPLVVCRSKSAGAHLLIFSAAAIPAALMVARLKEIAILLGFGRSEIFPKSITLAEGDCGSWLNMCYFADLAGKRWAVAPNGDALSAEEFLDVAEMSAASYTWFETPLPTATPPAGRIPIDKLLADALAEVANGQGRNIAGFQLFVAMRDAGYERSDAEKVKRVWVDQVNGANASAAKGRYLMEEATASLAQAYRRPARPPLAEGSGNGDGIVQQIEQFIVKDHYFAQDAGKLLYLFEDGVYKPTADEMIAGATRRYLESVGRGKSWAPEVAKNVSEYIRVFAPKLLETPPDDVLNLKNGLLNLDTLVLAPHSHTHLSSVQLNVEYSPAAVCPEIDRFVEQAFPADSHHVAWQTAAWLAQSDTSIQKMILLLGDGSNGKSIWLTLLETFLGRENISSVALQTLESDKFASSRLVGKLANVCADLPERALSGTSVMKSIVGGDSISAERKFKGSFDVRLFTKLVFSGNSLPMSDDSSHGYFRRWIIVPFLRTFDKDAELRKALAARLSTPSELSGMLNHALSAMAGIRAGKFTESDSLRAAHRAFHAESDPLAAWLAAHVVDEIDGFVVKDDLRSLYQQDCLDNDRVILRGLKFTKRLIKLRPRVHAAQRKVNGQVRECFAGITLRVDEAPLGLFGSETQGLPVN